MSDDDDDNTKMIGTVAILLFLGLLFSGYKSYVELSFMFGGGSSEGKITRADVVTETRRGRRGRTYEVEVLKLNYVFPVGDFVYTFEQSVSTSYNYSVGDTVDVEYLKADEIETARLTATGEQYWLMIFLAICGCGIGGLVYVASRASAPYERSPTRSNPKVTRKKRKRSSTSSSLKTRSVSTKSKPSTSRSKTPGTKKKRGSPPLVRRKKRE